MNVTFSMHVKPVSFNFSVHDSEQVNAPMDTIELTTQRQMHFQTNFHLEYKNKVVLLPKKIRSKGPEVPVLCS